MGLKVMQWYDRSLHKVSESFVAGALIAAMADNDKK